MKQIPNIFTLLNLFFGCIALVFILQGSLEFSSNSEGMPVVFFSENLVYASLFIGIAAIIDFLDGFVARLLGASSEMGKQLDSLADVVSFGVAPSMILFQFLRMSFIQNENGMNTSIAGLLPAFIFACAGAYRLARFNIDPQQSHGFKGVPIPAAGLLVASLPLINWFHGEHTNSLLTNKWFLYGLIILLSWLMISKLPLMALKFRNFSVKDNLPKYILVGIAVVAGVLLQWLAVPLVFVAYIILSLIYKEKR